MRRRKRYAILRIALGLAVAAIVPATALASQAPVNYDEHSLYQLGPGEIPYLNQDRQVMELGLSEGKKRPTAAELRALEIRGQALGNMCSDPTLTADAHRALCGIRALGLSDEPAVGMSPDDRPFSRATPVDTTPVVIVDDDGRSIDVNAFTVTGFALALLAAIGLGMGAAVWQSRKTNLSPA